MLVMTSLQAVYTLPLSTFAVATGNAVTEK